MIKIRNLILILYVVILAACSQTGGGGSDFNSPSTEKGGVGTIVNPPGYADEALTISYQMLAPVKEAVIDSPADNSVGNGAAEISVDSQCQEKTKDNTPICPASVQNYSVGLVGMEGANCLAPDGTNEVCHRLQNKGDVFTVDTFLLYDGALMPLSISDASQEFSGDLLAADASTMSALLLEVSYVQFSYSSPELGDADIRVCLADEKLLSAGEMETYCGNKEAKQGDYLIDLDHNGALGFAQVQDGALLESSVRIENGLFESNEKMVKRLTDIESDYKTSENFIYLVALQLPNVKEVISLDETKELILSFDVSHSVNFVDNNRDGVFSPLSGDEIYSQAPFISLSTKE